MSALHSKNTRVYANGRDLSPYLRSVSTEGTVEDSDSTTFGDTARAFTPGHTDANASGEGIVKTDGVDTELLFAEALGAPNTPVVALAADTLGAPGILLRGTQVKYALNFPYDDIVDVQAEWKASGGDKPIVVVLTGDTRTGTVTGAYVDLGAAQAAGSVGLAQLVDLVGFTAVAPKIQHGTSSTGPWVDAHVFASLTAIGATDEKTLVGALNRYVRVVATPTGTPGTFRCSVVLHSTN